MGPVDFPARLVDVAPQLAALLDAHAAVFWHRLHALPLALALLHHETALAVVGRRAAPAVLRASRRRCKHSNQHGRRCEKEFHERIVGVRRARVCNPL